MIAVSEIAPPRAALLFAGAVLSVGTSIYLLTPSTPVDTRTVVKVCRDGSLVLRTVDGDFEVVRPGAWRGWRAVGLGVCQ